MTLKSTAGFIALIFLVALAGPAPAGAENSGDIDWRVRGYYGVTGLKTGDTLNVRARASARAKIVGELERDALVFATGQTSRPGGRPWVQINHDDGLAWVNAAYLQQRQVINFGDTRAPIAGTCGGFEPGWDASWNRNGLSASSMSGPIGSARINRAFTPQGMLSPSVVDFTNPAARLRMTLVLGDTRCEALPLDRDYHQTGLLLVEKDGTLTAYSGCCEPAPEAIGTAN